MAFPHQSVLSKEISHYFQELSIKVFVDATLGAGGHAEKILSAHPEIESFVGIDQDPGALKIAQERLARWSDKVRFVQGNFQLLTDHLEELGIEQVDGILLDIGVSSMQLDFPERGFSFMRNGPLDMRMDPASLLTAEEIVNNWSQADLGWIFREYGEEKLWKIAARAIVSARQQRPIKTTQELAQVLLPVLSHRNKKKIHPLTLVFQALRICVNDELGVLEKVLPEALRCLRYGGRMAVISFHSLEDRIVKNFMRFEASDKWQTSGIGGMFLNKDPTVKILTKKPVIASEIEVEENPRSQSAKLRVIEKSCHDKKQIP